MPLLLPLADGRIGQSVAEFLVRSQPNYFARRKESGGHVSADDDGFVKHLVDSFV